MRHPGRGGPRTLLRAVEPLALGCALALGATLVGESPAHAQSVAGRVHGPEDPSELAPEDVAAAVPEEPPPPEAHRTAPEASEDARASRDRGRFFVRAGYTLGTSYARHGGIADRSIPFHPANRPADWDETTDGVYAPPGYASEAEWYGDMAAVYQGFTENPSNTYALPFPVTVDGVTYAEGPLRPDPNCEAERGELCVRLADERFVFVSGVDLEVGYRVLPHFAVSLGARLGFPAGEGALARALLTARVELALTRTSGRGLRAIASAGVGAGQIQLPIAQGQGVVAPFVASGLGNLNGALLLGYALTERFGLFGRPTVHVMFPRAVRVYEIAFLTETSF